jgi:hypothetical protein
MKITACKNSVSSFPYKLLCLNIHTSIAVIPSVAGTTDLFFAGFRTNV